MLGPGNQYVTAAKMLLQNSEAMISMDMPAGPSEVLVIADQGAPHAHVAADLLSQAEHGPDSQVTTSSAPSWPPSTPSCTLKPSGAQQDLAYHDLGLITSRQRPRPMPTWLQTCCPRPSTGLTAR